MASTSCATRGHREAEKDALVLMSLPTASGGKGMAKQGIWSGPYSDLWSRVEVLLKPFQHNFFFFLNKTSGQFLLVMILFFSVHSHLRESNSLPLPS